MSWFIIGGLILFEIVGIGFLIKWNGENTMNIDKIFINSEENEQ